METASVPASPMTTYHHRCDDCGRDFADTFAYSILCPRCRIENENRRASQTPEIAPSISLHAFAASHTEGYYHTSGSPILHRAGRFVERTPDLTVSSIETTKAGHVLLTIEGEADPRFLYIVDRSPTVAGV